MSVDAITSGDRPPTELADEDHRSRAESATAEEALEEEESGDIEAHDEAAYGDLAAFTRQRPPRIADEILPELERYVEEEAMPSGTSLRHRFAVEAENDQIDEEEPRGLLGRIFRR